MKSTRTVCTAAGLMSVVILAASGSGYASDRDGDSVHDCIDNCVAIFNPGQQDTNGDGFGNACDPDINNDNVVNFLDLAQLKSVIFTADADADFNGDGAVNFADLGTMKAFFFQPPGPGAQGAGAVVPAPFFRKPGNGSPSMAPAWYANKGPVNIEVFYDTDLSATENGDRLESILESLPPGGHLILHGGHYITNGGRLHLTQRSSAGDPTVISGSPNEDVVIERQNVSQNLMELTVSYLVLENITFVGGSLGLRFMTADNVMLYNNDISGASSSLVTANSGHTRYLYLVDNEIHHGNSHAEGFYLGSHSGSTPTKDCFVIGNYIHDLRDPGVTQGDGIEIKKNAERCLVKWNFVSATNYPAILAYGNGLGPEDRIVIEENVIVDSNTHSMQVAADAVIRNNLIVGGNASEAFLSIPHNGVTPENLEFYNNTLVSNGHGIRGSSWQSGMVFANNAIYSSSGQHFSSGGPALVQGNVHLTALDAFVGLSLNGNQLDATPSAGSDLDGAALGDFYPVNDLLGCTRMGDRDVGAIDTP